MIIDTKRSSKLYPNGTSDGMVRLVQRNEVNVGGWPIRFDSFPFEPGRLVLFSIPQSSPRIFSTFQTPPSSLPVGIFHFLENFSFGIWIYILISLTLCTILPMLITFLIDNEGIICILKYCKIIFGTWWNIFMLFIDLSPNRISKMISFNTLWVSIVLGTYYGIHMILLNTLSADLTIFVEGRSVESLYDFMYDESFQHLKPLVLNLESNADTLSQSREGTIERALYNRVIKESGIIDMNALDWDVVDFKEVLELYGNPFIEGKNAIIEDFNLAHIIMKHAGCHNSPDLVRTTKFSKDDILTGVRGILVSFHTHYELFKLIQYRVQTMIELGTFNGYLIYAKMKNSDAFVNGLIGKGFECEEKLSNTLYVWNGLKDDEQSSPPPSPLSFYQQLFYICIGLLIVSFSILIIELLYRIIERKKKKLIIRTINFQKRITKSADIVRKRNTIKGRCATSYPRNLNN